jgi:hypothetical protein
MTSKDVTSRTEPNAVVAAMFNSLHTHKDFPDPPAYPRTLFFPGNLEDKCTDVYEKIAPALKLLLKLEGSVHARLRAKYRGYTCKETRWEN